MASPTSGETVLHVLAASPDTDDDLAHKIETYLARQRDGVRASVKTHVSNILRKLDLDNRTQVAGLHARRETP